MGKKWTRSYLHKIEPANVHIAFHWTEFQNFPNAENVVRVLIKISLASEASEKGHLIVWDFRERALIGDIDL